MKKNMGGVDKLIRLVVAAIFVVLYLLEVVSDTLGIVLIALAGIFALTSLISFCPLYLPFGISTATKEKK